MCSWIREEKRNRYQAGRDTEHTKQNPNKHTRSPTFNTGQKASGREGCLCKEHLHAIRVSKTKSLASTTLHNPDSHWFYSQQVCMRGQSLHLGYLMFAYLQFVTWLVYSSFCSFITHLCPRGLISSGPIPGRKPPGLSPHFVNRTTQLRRRTLNEAWPPFSLGNSRERSQKCVFTFMFFHKSSSCPLEWIFFKSSCTSSRKGTRFC